MKGRAIKAPVKPNGKGGGVVPKLLPPKLVAPKRNPSMIIKNSPPAGEGGEGSSGRRETEIHRTGPMGEVNILRLDSNGETMMLEKGDMMRLYDDDGATSAEILRLDTAVAQSKSPKMKSEVGVGLGPLTVTGKGIVSATREADILRIHTGEEGGNMIWMQGAGGGTPMMELSTPAEGAPAEPSCGRVMYAGGGATPSTGGESADGKPSASP